MGISIIEIRCSWDSLISIMEIPILIDAIFLLRSPLTPSPDLNLTPLAAFLRFCQAQRGSDRTVLEIRGGLQGEKWIISRHDGENSCTDSKCLHYLWRDWLFMWRSRYSEIFISTFIPTYKGNSLRKSLHNHLCYILVLLFRPDFVMWSASFA